MKLERKNQQNTTKLSEFSLVELEKMLKDHTERLSKLQRGHLQAIINQYHEYLTIDASTRAEYESLTKQLALAAQKLKFYKDENYYLYDLYRLGECEYYCNGTPQEIEQSQEEVTSLTNKIKELEAKEPKLTFRRSKLPGIPSPVSSVYASLLTKKKQLEQEIESRKKENKR